MTRVKGGREQYEVRREACRCAAMVAQAGDEAPGADRLWALCVFFETYLERGSVAAKQCSARPPAPR